MYLAARYSRRVELCAYRDDLIAAGCEVTSRWLNGTHEAIDGTASHEQRGAWAQEDLEDIDAAEVLIAFTESADSGHSRGGRHVELGYALSRHRMPARGRYGHWLMEEVHVVGPAENLFCAYPGVLRHETWPRCLAVLLRRNHAGVEVDGG